MVDNRDILAQALRLAADNNLVVRSRRHPSKTQEEMHYLVYRKIRGLGGCYSRNVYLGKRTGPRALREFVQALI